MNEIASEKTATTPPAERSDKRQAIMNAALELFAERGFHGTPMPMIAERAGVSAGTIYRYFDSKEALVNSLFLHWHGLIDQTIFADLNGEHPCRHEFDLIYARVFDFARRNPLAFNFLCFHHHLPYLDEASMEMMNVGYSRGLAFLTRCREQGLVKDMDVAALMSIIEGIVIGLARASMNCGKLELTDELVKQATQCAWEAIRQ